MQDLYKQGIFEIQKKIKNKELTVLEVTQHYLDRIKKMDARIASFNSVFEFEALAQARKTDEKLKSGAVTGLLSGIPVAIKDNMCIKGGVTTCSSRMLQNYVSPYDAEVIKKIRQENGIIIGKTNMDEFAMGSSTENSAFKITRNPWNTEYIPGGSSGGSAASVSAGLAPVSLGSDTGGSIRQPASCCGVIGFKPTYGRVSRYGLVAFASSLDQIGGFSKNIRDCILLHQVISGYDSKDSTSVDRPVDFLPLLEKTQQGIKGLKVGLPREYFVSGINPEVEKALKGAVKVIEGLGAKIEEISLPHAEYAVAVYYIIASSEASANLARYDGVRYGYRSEEHNTKNDKEQSALIEVYNKTRGQGFGQEVKRRIMLGTYSLAAGYYDAYYNKAQKVRTLIKLDFDKAFQKVDVVVTPTSPTPAFKIGEKFDDPLQMYLSDIYTIPCNLAGLPGISMPCGFSSSNLPIGLQILGKAFDEKTVLSLALEYEQATDWHLKWPNV